MNFGIHILGSGTCVPSVKRAPSGYLMNLDDVYYLFDGGSGTLRQIAAINIDYNLIETIFYTHLHVDHTAELLPLLFARKYDPSSSKQNTLNIYGPIGILDHIRNLEKLAGKWVYSENNNISVTELTAGSELNLPGGKVKAYGTYHQPNSIGYRVSCNDGRVLCYTGDSDDGEGLIGFLQNASLAIAECSFPDQNKTKGHLTPTELGIIAAKAGVKRLVLTHLYPEMDNIDAISIIKEHFTGSVELGEDLMEYIP